MKGDLFSSEHMVQPATAPGMTVENAKCIRYAVKTVKGSGIAGGGLFNSVFTGKGLLGLVCEGNPLVIPVSPQYPVYVDTDAVVGWSANLQTSLHRSQSIGSMLRGGSGEAVQLMLQGEGF